MIVESLNQSRYDEPTLPLISTKRVKRALIFLLVIIFVGACFSAAKVDFSKLIDGLPRIASWFTQMFPPDLENIDRVLRDAFQTLAMATIGTIGALIICIPLAPLAARNTTPNMFVYRMVRAVFAALRGTEILVFALIFVAAVGFGPFTGVLAIMFNMVGALGKLLTEVIEPADPGPVEAVELTGASSLRAYRYALVPDVWPNIVAVTLYIWEFNVRASTVLGIVGAGGIGQTLKDSIDLLDFPKMATVLGVILIMVITIDTLSGFLRRRVLNPETASVREGVPKRLSQTYGEALESGRNKQK
ncbi:MULTISPECIES: phosphonate ABC transporter, permease protein PhnE [Alphaproteobacteria]|uniref:Phosphonate ABC transporter, permease protein PhnE n=1 Tax=Roseibium aggregatum TaxID=187304 RepID=A0A939ECT2_9HYPH|nr:phosphonate ABC transporter, permease protein PhnE [Roseibium aggregatum]MBN9670249.1 phosphonate ABC transporter, permease protein PhnE [Roseibium aggregatum]